MWNQANVVVDDHFFAKISDGETAAEPHCGHLIGKVFLGDCLVGGTGRCVVR